MQPHNKTAALSFSKLGGSAQHQISHGSEILFRIGYAAYGLIYLLIGSLAFALAIGMGGKITDPKGALATIGQQPFGKFILLLLGVGLVGYVLWRFAQAFLNIEHKPNKAKYIFARIGQAISGIIYSAIAVVAIRGFMAEGQTSSGGGSPWARLMAMDGGHYIIMAVGAILLIVAATQVFKGVKEKFMEGFEGAHMTADEEKAVRVSGKVGYIARGVTFAIIGYFCLKAGFQHDPSEAKTTKSALEFIAAQPFGTIALGVVAAGFIAFAIHCLLAAKNQRFARV
jgi:hypothetical protein